MPNDIESLLRTHFLVSEKKPDHYFRTEIPNIVYELDIDCYEFKLYAYIKKIAGDSGGCWKSKATIETECLISKRKIDEALKTLAKPQDLLNGQALVKIIPRKDQPSLIIINDIWRINGDFMREKSKEKNTNAQDAGEGVQEMQGGGGAGNAYKEDPIINSDCNDFDVASDKLKIFDSNQNCREIIIDDLYFICSKFGFNWTIGEINFLWQRLCKHKGIISDLVKFSEAIIKKERFVKKIQKNKQGKKCQTIKPTQPNKSPNMTGKNEYNQERGKSETTNSQTLDEDTKKRPFANWRETLGL